MSSNHGNKAACLACGAPMRNRKTKILKSKYHECCNPACGATYLAQPGKPKP